jgi:hypothetical protein
MHPTHHLLSRTLHCSQLHISAIGSPKVPHDFLHLAVSTSIVTNIHYYKAMESQVCNLCFSPSCVYWLYAMAIFVPQTRWLLRASNISFAKSDLLRPLEIFEFHVLSLQTTGANLP